VVSEHTTPKIKANNHTKITAPKTPVRYKHPLKTYGTTGNI